MGDDKIKITWEEVHSTKVDQALRKREHITRTQEHQARAALRPLAPSSAQTSIFRHTLFYMALFGLIGGMLAWGLGEIVHAASPEALSDYYAGRRAMTKMIEEDGLTVAGIRAFAQQFAPRNRYWALYAEYADGDISQTEFNYRFQQMASKEERKEFVFSMIFFSLVGLFLAMFLSIAEPAVSRNWNRLAVDGSIAAVLGLVAGILVSLFINKIYHALGGGQGGDILSVSQILARSIGWGILGLFMAIAPGITLRSPKKIMIGLIGGALGGLLGGLLFDPIAYLTDSGVASRLAGIVSIGVLSGLGIGLIEDALKTGWFKVTAGMIAGKQFVLYRNPTTIGSSPQCDIYLFKDVAVEPRHAQVHLQPGSITIQNAGQKQTFVNGQPVTRKRLLNGDQVQIGGTVFTFQERTGR